MPSSIGSEGQARSEVSSSCSLCKSRHKKCDGAPCLACQRRGLHCSKSPKRPVVYLPPKPQDTEESEEETFTHALEKLKAKRRRKLSKGKVMPEPDEDDVLPSQSVIVPAKEISSKTSRKDTDEDMEFSSFFNRKRPFQFLKRAGAPSASQQKPVVIQLRSNLATPLRQANFLSEDPKGKANGHAETDEDVSTDGHAADVQVRADANSSGDESSSSSESASPSRDEAKRPPHHARQMSDYDQFLHDQGILVDGRGIPLRTYVTPNRKTLDTTVTDNRDIELDTDSEQEDDDVFQGVERAREDSDTDAYQQEDDHVAVLERMQGVSSASDAESTSQSQASLEKSPSPSESFSISVDLQGESVHEEDCNDAPSNQTNSRGVAPDDSPLRSRISPMEEGEDYLELSDVEDIPLNSSFIRKGKPHSQSKPKRVYESRKEAALAQEWSSTESDTDSEANEDGDDTSVKDLHAVSSSKPSPDTKGSKSRLPYSRIEFSSPPTLTKSSTPKSETRRRLSNIFMSTPTSRLSCPSETPPTSKDGSEILLNDITDPVSDSMFSDIDDDQPIFGTIDAMTPDRRKKFQAYIDRANYLTPVKKAPSNTLQVKAFSSQPSPSKKAKTNKKVAQGRK